MPPQEFQLELFGSRILLSRLQLQQSLILLLPEELHPWERFSFNPFQSTVGSRAGEWGFVAIRLLGLPILVLLVEEVFRRGFLSRWVISPDWQDQEIGRAKIPLNYRRRPVAPEYKMICAVSLQIIRTLRCRTEFGSLRYLPYECYLLLNFSFLTYTCCNSFY